MRPNPADEPYNLPLEAEVGPTTRPATVDRLVRRKRVFDVAVAAVLLGLTLPLLLAIAVVIRLTSPGPALFVQLRAGKDGRPFRLYKFRTMHTAADEDAHRRFVRDFINGGGSFTAKEHGARKYGVTEDDRITRVGRVLRASCLDEVPQLWNVIRGEMSIVGPRPAVLYELPYYASRHRRRLSVTPGLTGLWQVGCRSATSFEEMVELDLYYIDHWSLFLDIAIVLKTVRVLLTGVGRY